MIKNIVFDLGNVLISFKPDEFLEKEGYPADYRNLVLNDVFRSKEWRMIDRGDLTLEEAIRNISGRSSLNKREIEAVFDLRLKILQPVAGNVKVLPDLKKRGFKLYFLSNFPEDIFDDVFDQNPFFKIFDGGFISASVNCSKPERRIFEILFERYSINPVECLFIDDDESNIKTAVSTGMSVIHLTKMEELEELLFKKLD
jgi:HAD superfamily hydrolase (TIGR01509 family)